MIVLSHKKGWKIITQRSHGLLAAMIANQYNINLPNEIFVPTLIAIAEHDDGVVESEESKNLTEAGAPRNFLVDSGSKTTDLKQQYSVMEASTSKSQLNALLTSMHIDFVFGTCNDSVDSKLKNYLKQQKDYRKKILKHLEVNQNYADMLYCFMEWCDAFSLLICLDKIQIQGRKIEISKNHDGGINEAFYIDNNRISVDPWCFKSLNFEVYYEYRIIEQLKFNSVEEFDKVFKDCEVNRETFIISKK